MSTPVLLFTAFEPSGDAHAAPVIARLRAEQPQWRIVALGGVKMAAAGAELIESTTDNAAMLGHAAGRIMEHRRLLQRLKIWLARQPIAAHIPVDSPAANFPICELVRKLQPQARIVHLVAPQLWAWGGGRIRKLRRLTDHVLCLLPFEEAWFRERGAPATFVGHPVFDERSDQPPAEEPFPMGAPKLALLPGSRSAEIETNWPTMLAAFELLRARWPYLRGVVAAANAQAEDQIGAINLKMIAHDKGPSKEAAAGLSVRVGQTGAVLDWADAALVVSGTATLLTAAHATPMVALYNVNWWAWQLIGRWLIRTRTFTLPNIIAQYAGKDRIIHELVPHFASPAPVAQAVEHLLASESQRKQQIQNLHWLGTLFSKFRFAETAVAKLQEVIHQDPKEGAGQSPDNRAM